VPTIYREIQTLARDFSNTEWGFLIWVFTHVKRTWSILFIII